MLLKNQNWLELLNLRSLRFLKVLPYTCRILHGVSSYRVGALSGDAHAKTVIFLLIVIDLRGCHPPADAVADICCSRCSLCRRPLGVAFYTQEDGSSANGR